MALQDIFNQINSNYATVRSIADNIRRYYDGQIRVALNTMTGYVDGAVRLIPDMIHTSSKLMARALEQNVWIIDESLRQTTLTTNSITDSLQSIFNTYLYNVIEYVKDASAYIQVELYDEVDALALSVDAQLFDLESYLNGEVDKIYDSIDMLSVDVVGWIDAAVADVADTLNARIDQVDTELTTRIDFLEDWTAQVIQALYDYVDIKDQEVLQELATVENTLYVYINNRVKELDNYINSVSNTLHQRISVEVDRLDESITTVEITLTERIEELADTTGWNFTFFDLFTFRPELALLRVLIRSEDSFNYYKPYYQALFARVMEED